MIIKKYIVKNEVEAKEKIKKELGDQAIIISQKRISSDGLKGLFLPKSLEVTAALDNSNDDSEVSLEEVENNKEIKKDAELKKEQMNLNLENKKNIDVEIKEEKSIDDITRLINQKALDAIKKYREYDAKDDIDAHDEEIKQIESKNDTYKKDNEFKDCTLKEDEPKKEEVKKYVFKNKGQLKSIVPSNLNNMNDEKVDFVDLEFNYEDDYVNKEKSNIIKNEKVKEIENKEKIKVDVKQNINPQKSKNNIKVDNGPKENKIDNRIEEIGNEVEDMKRLIQQLVQNNDKNSFISNKINELDIDEDYIDEIEKYNNVKGSFDNAVKEILKNDLNIYNKDLKGKIVLVGPTGVGKTTTIAKLAGRFLIDKNKKVGLITIDTYRIGAVEQLKIYADIMNIKFKVVKSLNQMNEAIKDMEDVDVLLIDTTGRSSKNESQILEMKKFIKTLKPNHTLMAISATTKNKDIKMILKSYNELEYNKVIITKLDETKTYGSLLTIIKNTDKPVAYITTGQSVPEDLKVPTKKEFAKLILGVEDVC